jgi:C-terminal processing protease CtpA/Prc
LGAVESDWAKVEPKVTAGQKRAAELTNIINTTRVLDVLIDDRFYWAPFLQKLSRCIAPNAQITSMEGFVTDDNKAVTVTIEGVSAGREPRSAAEDLRQLLIEQLGQNSLGLQTRTAPSGQSASENGDLIVDEITPGSPAAEAQLQKDDIIRKFDGHEVKSFSEVLGLASQVEINKRVELEILRDGKPAKVTAQIKDHSADYSDVKVQFKTLEDLDTIVNVGGTTMAMARYVLTVNFNTHPSANPAATSDAARTPKR